MIINENIISSMVITCFMAGKYETEYNPKRTLHVLTLKIAFGDDKNPGALINHTIGYTKVTKTFNNLLLAPGIT